MYPKVPRKSCKIISLLFLFFFIILSIASSQNILIASIEMYQKYISPHKGFNCAYHHLHPNDKTCSEYGKYAITNHGVFTGLKLLNDRFDACKNAANLIRIANIIKNQNPQNCDQACDSIGNDCSRGCAEGRDALWREIKAKIDEEVSKIKDKITETIKKIWNDSIEWISGIIQDIFNEAEETIDQTTDVVDDAIPPSETIEDEFRSLIERAIATSPTDIQFDEIIDGIIENYEDGNFTDTDNNTNELWEELPPPYRIVASAKMNIGKSSGITEYPYGFDPIYNNEMYKEAIDYYIEKDNEKVKEIIQNTCHSFKVNEKNITVCYSQRPDIVQLIINRIDEIKPNKTVASGIEAQQLLGVRKQCKEWVNFIAKNNGGVVVPYPTKNSPLPNLTAENASPGKAVYLKYPQHAAIIIGLVRKNDRIIGIQIAESNWANEWILPVGQVPWERYIKTRTIESDKFSDWRIADIYEEK